MNTAQTSPICLLVFMLAAIPLSVRGGNGPVPDTREADTAAAGADNLAAGTGTVNPAMLTPLILPIVLPVQPPQKTIPAPPETGIDWKELLLSSGRFLAAQHAFRLFTEPGTRSGLKGSFFGNYANAVSNLHGWADGDEFYVNYIGHPMQGSVAGYLWVQNDRRYRHAEFGRNRDYWMSRLRAGAFAYAYSVQFEIGPLSEASIGGIQSTFPQQGFVDHVVTPAIGLGWMIAEDAVDRYLIRRIEDLIPNKYVGVAVRGALNPSRSFANFMGGRLPWDRETRPGLFRASAPMLAAPRPEPNKIPDTRLAPSFEFATTFQPERFLGSKSTSCLGGGAMAGFRLASSWQLIADVSGCKMTGLENDVSGDSLTYMVGPRWIGRISDSWTAHAQALVGGQKLTEERMYPNLKKQLEAAAIRDNKQPPVHEDYTDRTESNAFAVAGGGGVDYACNQALTIRVADVTYRHSWNPPMWGRDFSNTVKVTSGLVIRFGNW